MFTAILGAVSAIGGMFKALLGFLTIKGHKKAGADEANLENVAESRDRLGRSMDARDGATGVRDKDFGGE